MPDIHYHFIGNAESNDSLETLCELEWEKGTIACVRHAWIWPLYCRLKMRGMPVSFSYSPMPGAVNFIHGQVARFLLKPRDFKEYFIVAVRADFRPFPFGRFEIVQNRHADGGRRVFMPHFPQPGLRPRDGRRELIENVCFSGEANNCFDASALSEELTKLGCRYVFKGQGDWQNMQDVDILLGIRSLSKNRYHSKPPTKLFNAWLAGIPFIGGYDSAYEQVGTPGRNYLRVADYGELVDAIRMLKNDNGLYARLVANGRQAAVDYTPERITDRWLALLDGEVAKAYRDWAKGSPRHEVRSVLGGVSFLCERKFRACIKRVKSFRG